MRACVCVCVFTQYITQITLLLPLACLLRSSLRKWQCSCECETPELDAGFEEGVSASCPSSGPHLQRGIVRMISIWVCIFVDGALSGVTFHGNKRKTTNFGGSLCCDKPINSTHNHDVSPTLAVAPQPQRVASCSGDLARSEPNASYPSQAWPCCSYANMERQAAACGRKSCVLCPLRKLDGLGQPVCRLRVG